MEKNERLAWRTKPRTYCRCFSSCTKRNCNGRPFQLQISFDFPLQTPLRAGSELFRCFSSCPKRGCNGRPFQLANFKRKLFRAWKVVFWFSPPDTLESRQWAFQVLFQLPKAQLQWETLPTGKFKKNFSGPEKLFFDFPLQKTFRGRESFATAPPPSHVWTRLVPQKPRELPILMERGEVINSEFRFSEARYTI